MTTITNFTQKTFGIFNSTIDGYKYMITKMKEIGFKETMNVIYRDMFSGRSLFDWIYLVILGSLPVIFEFMNNGKIVDWTGLLASVTGIICVILVGEGRASNYLFGTINSLIYLMLSLDATFYGELATTIYFLIMQPIGLFIWIGKSREKTESQEFVAKRLDFKGWVKYLLITLVWWATFGFAYKSIGSARPFRDSVTDGTNGVGQLLMNNVYQEQWIFWIATNLFSMYLWWGTNPQMIIMYVGFLINSIYGWYRWNQQVKKG